MKNFRLFSVVASLMMMTATIAQNTNSIFGSDISIQKGETTDLIIQFTFDEEDLYTAVSFDLSLPTGITIDKNERGKLIISKGDGLEESHTISSNYVANEDVYAFACYSGESDPFKGVSGTLFTAKLKADPSIDASVFPQKAKIQNIKLTTVDEIKKKLSDSEFSISIVDNCVELSELSETAPAPINNVKVIVTRTIKNEEWSTICLPFSMTEDQVKTAFGEKVKLGDFTGCTTTKTGDKITSIKVNFEAATAIEANHPYIIWVLSPISSFTVEGVSIVEPNSLTINKDENSENHEFNQFIGTYIANTVLPSNSLFLYGNKFWYSNGNKIKAFRGYFKFYDILDYDSANSNITLAFDEADGINNVTAGQPAEGIYDIQGRKVHTDENKPLKKGVYIINGKKVVK